MLDVLVQTGHADSGAAVVVVVIVIAYMEKEIPVVKDTDSGQLVICSHR
jgi:hypothetical protein